MWVMIIDEARIQVINDHKENCREIQVPKFCNRDCFWIQVSDCNGNCGAEYKYQIATETVEQNTSKQVSAKETALQNVYKYSRIIYFLFFIFYFWSRVNVEKWSRGNEMEVIQGRNGPSLDGYLRWKSFSNSLACSSSITSNYLESLLVSSYPSHIILYSSLHALQWSILESTILEISYSGSPSMITGAGRGSECCWKVLGVASSSIETWNTRWTALIVSGRQSVKDCGLGWVIILYDLRYFSEFLWSASRPEVLQSDEY